MKAQTDRSRNEKPERDDDSRPFRLQLIQRLADAKIDIAALWRTLDGTPGYSRLAALLNSACFTMPDEFERHGYKQEDIEEARRVAAATVDSSFRDIVALAEQHRPVPPEAAESPPTTVIALDGVDESVERAPQAQRAEPETALEPGAVRSYQEMT